VLVVGYARNSHLLLALVHATWLGQAVAHCSLNLSDQRHDQRLEEGQIIIQPELEAMMDAFTTLHSDVNAFQRQLLLQLQASGAQS
jgi:hypothetical protein